MRDARLPSRLAHYVRAGGFYACNALFAGLGMLARRLRHKDGIFRVQVVRLDKLGDAVLTAPLYRDLRHLYPKAEITAVVNKRCVTVLEYCPHINHLHAFAAREDSAWHILGTLIRAAALHVHLLLKPLPDLVLFPCIGPCRLDLLFLSMCGAKRRILFESALPKWGIFPRWNCPEILPPPQGMHLTEVNTQLVRHLGGASTTGPLQMWTSNEDRKQAAELLKRFEFTGCNSPRPLVAIMPGAGEPRRLWPSERYASLVRWLLQQMQANVIVLGGTEDIQKAHEIIDAIGVDGRGRLVDAAGICEFRTVYELLLHCRMYIGSDTGCMHLAAAAGIPVVELTHYTPGDDSFGSPIYFRPWNVPYRILQPRKALSPCVTRCIADVPHCIRQITDDEARSAVQSLWQQTAVAGQIQAMDV